MFSDIAARQFSKIGEKVCLFGGEFAFFFGLFNQRRSAILTCMKKCHVCKRELTLDRTIGRTEECAFCRADLHCCLNCAFHDKTASKQCREPVAEPIKEKQKANYCGYFRFADADACPGESALEQCRKELGDLFKR